MQSEVPVFFWRRKDEATTVVGGGGYQAADTDLNLAISLSVWETRDALLFFVQKT